MSQPLVPVGVLVSSGWEQFKNDWKANLELSVRFVISAAILFAAAVIGQPLPLAGKVAISLLAIVTASAINLYTILALIEFALRRDRSSAGEAKLSVEIGRTHFLPFLIVLILQSLAIFGGLVVFFLPGIWLSVLLAYSVLCLVEDGAHGLAALQASAALVKGRWWATFGRNIVTGVVVALLGSLTTFIVLLIIGAFIGMDQVFVFAQYVGDATQSNPVADGISSVLNGIVQALFVPLGVIYQVKIFHSLKKTR
jgi:hypothetical protein